MANIWGPVDQETQQKIKYAKWNAARIIKAIKEGKDPNESNPRQQDAQQQELGPDDAAAQSLGSAPSAVTPRPVTVEEVPDADLRRDTASVSLPQSPTSAGPSPAAEAELKLPGVPTDLSQPARPGYSGTEQGFPPPSQQPGNLQGASDLPAPPAGGWTPSQPSPATSPPPTAWSQPPVSPPAAGGFHNQPSAPTTAPPTFATGVPPTAAVVSPPANAASNAYNMSTAPSASTYAPAQVGGAIVDEAAMAEAQKHAKWAISALNFEDVPTAIKELRKALELLGAT